MSGIKNSKRWETIVKIKNQKSKIKNEDIFKILLQNRGLKTKKEVEEFLHPKLETVTAAGIGINKIQLKRATERIKKAVKEEEQIVVFGDYDVDGICGAAILWETLHDLGAKATPYIPHRIDEGYGLSIKGISNVKRQISNVGLIITVDNGIVAGGAVDFANKSGIDVIIIDHHLPPVGGSKKLPKAYAIVQTTKLCAAGVAWVFARELEKNDKNHHLELVALATIADLVPLLGANRTLVKFGLEELKKTKRVGLLELFKDAGINKEEVNVYEVGHMIAPRLNATGRLDYAMDSLRLICTKDKNRARSLAEKIGLTNRERQELTMETALHAIDQVRSLYQTQKLLFVSSKTYQQGVIGLVAGKLVEEFYRPAIVVSKGEIYSKASARSVKGFNIIEFIRSASDMLIDAGGHPMAAGFTVETAKLSALEKVLSKAAKDLLDEKKLTRALRIDCELPFSYLNEKLYDSIQKLSPFGMGNPEPTFVSKNVMIEDLRLVGNEGKHLKLEFKSQKSKVKIGAIAFGMGEKTSKIHIGDAVDIVYTIEQDEWLALSGVEGNKKLQLKIKDIRKTI